MTPKTGLQSALEHGFTEEQYRAAKAIEARIFGSYQWQNQGDRAATMVVAICDALRKEGAAERAACAEVARYPANTTMGAGPAEQKIVDKTCDWIAAAIEARSQNEEGGGA